MDTRFFRVAVYSLLGLCGLTLCVKVSHPLLNEAIFLLFCLFPAILETIKKDVPLFSFFPKN